VLPLAAPARSLPVLTSWFSYNVTPHGYMLCGPTHHYHTENIDLLYSPLNKICLQDFMLYCSLLRITKKEEQKGGVANVLLQLLFYNSSSTDHSLLLLLLALFFLLLQSLSFQDHRPQLFNVTNDLLLYARHCTMCEVGKNMC
jgi:hypothetical protein